MVQSGIPFNMQDSTDRQYKLLSSYLDLLVEQEPAKATRKVVPLSDDPILKKVQEFRSGNNEGDSKVIYEHTVTEKDR